MRLTKRDLKVDYDELAQIEAQAKQMLAETIASLIAYLRMRYGDLPQAKHVWLEALYRMREHEFPSLVQEEAVRTLIEKLEGK